MVDDASLADALWRAICYATVCQLHLRDNIMLQQPLAAAHVKEHPSGHWGTVPGTAWALSHIALAAGTLERDVDLVPLLGAGPHGWALPARRVGRQRTPCVLRRSGVGNQGCSGQYWIT
ncbi:hypothetical protein [Streptomyces sp. MK37H]|uniref:hypothetical protein n=1 Tax=Streptomyces sp. MK37H TaxID=2699117 RepID=UPI001FFA1D23|nr:hypothetical protein [Streptomyces sp. MK37H]